MSGSTRMRNGSEASGAVVSQISDVEYESLPPAAPVVARDVAAKSSVIIVTLACAAAVAFALVGAAYAIDFPGRRDAFRGDLIAAPSGAPTLTIEDANLDAGISILTAVPQAGG